MINLKKSALVFLVISIAPGLVCAQWPLGRESLQTEAKSSDQGQHLTGSGRFQVFVSPQAKGYTFMIDTDSGRVWIMKKDHSSGEFSLHRIPVDGLDASENKVKTPSEKKTDSR